MKQFFLLAALLFSGQIFGQAWVPIGTKWDYSLDNWIFGGSTTYEWPVTCTDTVEFDGKFYSKLEYEGNCASWGALASPAYLRADSNRVFYRDNGTDKLLYDFNTPLFGSWTLRLPWTIEVQSGPTDSIQIMVVGVDTFNYFGQKRRAFHLQYDNYAGDWGDYFLEGIGSNSFLFPQYPVCDPQAYCLHKFYHPSFGEFGTGDCIVSVHSPHLDQGQLRATPNPASGIFAIDNQQAAPNSLLEIFSFSGSKTREFRDPPAHFEVDLGGEPAGVFFAKWTLPDGRFSVKKLVLK